MAALTVSLTDEYVIKGLGSTLLKLDNGSKLHSICSRFEKEFVIYCLEDKRERIVFVDGKVLVWEKDSSIDIAKVIGVRETSETRSKEILDLIHSDACELMSDKSLGGHLYYVTFIDDHSRKTWFYLLKTKMEYLISSRRKP